MRFWEVLIPLVLAASSLDRCSAISLVRSEQLGSVRLGSAVQNFSSTERLPYSEKEELIVHSIQKDIWEEGNILAAIGNAIYSLHANGSLTILAGHTEAGDVNGYFKTARFNQITGFAQIHDGIILISDKNNQCIRRLDRNDGEVSLYYGHWRDFHTPGSMRFDSMTNMVYIFDEIEDQPMIVSKKLYSGEDGHVINTSLEVNDFVHLSDSNSFVVSADTGLYKMSLTGEITPVTTTDGESYYGLAYYDGLLLATSIDRNVITVLDTQQDYKYLFTLCSSTPIPDSLDTPSCAVEKPTAVAVVDAFLYFSSFYRNSIANTQISYIKRISLAATHQDEVTTNQVYIEDKKLPTTVAASKDKPLNTQSVVCPFAALMPGVAPSTSNGKLIAGILIPCLLVLCSVVLGVMCRVKRWHKKFRSSRHSQEDGSSILTVAPPIAVGSECRVTYAKLETEDSTHPPTQHDKFVTQ